MSIIENESINKFAIVPNASTQRTKHANLSADMSKFKAEIDKLVYQLYGLTENEIKIVKGVK